MHPRCTAFLPQAVGSKRSHHSGLPQGKSSKAFFRMPRRAGQPRAIAIDVGIRECGPARVELACRRLAFRQVLPGEEASSRAASGCLCRSYIGVTSFSTSWMAGRAKGFQNRVSIVLPVRFHGHERSPTASSELPIGGQSTGPTGLMTSFIYPKCFTPGCFCPSFWPDPGPMAWTPSSRDISSAVLLEYSPQPATPATGSSDAPGDDRTSSSGYCRQLRK
jgi:hypothetical protein